MYFCMTDPIVPISQYARAADMLDELAANATKHNIGFVLFNGNDDFITRQFETECTYVNLLRMIVY